MSKWISSTALILALLTLAIFSGRSVKADDSSTTQPSTTKGSITVTVLDSSSNPVVKANVKLYAKQKPADSDADNGAPAKPKAIGSGKTDDDGKYTFTDVAPGDYKVNATQKKIHGKGSVQVSVTSDAPNPTVTITFAAPEDNGGATTAPSAQAQ
jgi:hypothetical protein